MPPTKRDIEDVLYGAVVNALAPIGLTDQQIVWADQPLGDGTASAPQPDTPYCTLKIISGPTRVGIDDEIITPPVLSPLFDVYTRGQREFTLSVQGFGDISSDIVQAVTNYFQSPSVNGEVLRAQSNLVQVDTADPSSLYQIILGEDVFDVTSGPAATAEDIRNDFVALIDASTNYDAVAETPVNQMTITGKPGKFFLISLDPRLSLLQTVDSVDVAFTFDNGEVDISDVIDSSHFEKRSALDMFFLTCVTNQDANAGIIETVAEVQQNFC